MVAQRFFFRDLYQICFYTYLLTGGNLMIVLELFCDVDCTPLKAGVKPIGLFLHWE